MKHAARAAALLALLGTAPAAYATSAAQAYVVAFRADTLPAAALTAKSPGEFSAALNLPAEVQMTRPLTEGTFATVLSPAALAHLSADPRVASIEPDQTVQINPILNVAAKRPASGVTWGLDRVNQVQLPLDHTFGAQRSGAGVRVYVLDTGIRAAHAELRGRVDAGWSAVQDGRGTDDCNGHGTHVAGTIGGQNVGLARGVTLVPVRVLDCNGQGHLSDILAGLEWVRTHRQGPSVVNLSLGADVSPALDEAVTRLWQAGVTVIVAAGNNAADACTQSPAHAPKVIAVGASTPDDRRAPFSNFGPCVKIYAPGDHIESASARGDQATSVMSGTSMAAPHVAAYSALLLHINPFLTPDQVERELLARATLGALTDTRSGPNRLLYVPDCRICTQVK
ncbi:S8 family peptidase [Deinococcus radiotolerans]|uniref:Peptidase S8/S53 domain-containing protein n=1 Tax=Deinococcus radiotolerans TaxID=1309407 RepID=A0ABQ2FNH2_9DEIO|nr:S8 family peptidase [Deinococcus radiotolerans]GGL11431.1 hypothetical protein GCM10010844_32670 [Deinococcus radiotolerans]